MLQNGDLERLAITRSLTAPGLEALLRLGQRELESARFHNALDWLMQALEHPDLSGQRAAHCSFMIAMAAHYSGDPAQFEAASTWLSELGSDGEEFLASLRNLADQQLPAHEQAISTLDDGETSDLHDLVPQAIWSFELKDSLLRRRFMATEVGENDDREMNMQLERRIQESEFTTAAITIVGPVAYLNEGHTILALNRLTGRQLWSYPDVDPISLVDLERTDALDMNVIDVADGALVTLTGHAMPNSRSQAGKVICLDSETGSLRWMQNLSGLVEIGDEESLFPHGAPIIADGTVYIAARKVSPQLLTSAYVVALDLATGPPALGQAHHLQRRTAGARAAVLHAG